LGEFAGQLRNNVDYIIVGRILGATSLGIYTLSYRIPELIIRSVNLVMEKVLFPLLSQMQSDTDRLRSIYFGYIRYMAMFTFPMGFGLALVSQLFVESFLPGKWLQVVTPMILISIALAISSIGHAPGILYKAINRPEILNQLSLIKIPTIALIVWYATRWGIIGVAVGQIIFAFITLLLDGYMVSRVIKFDIREMWYSLIPATFCTVGMVGVVGAVKLIFTPSGIGGLIFTIFVGAVAFLVTLSFVDRNLMDLAYATLRKRIERK
jgi:lipopolysaccharide exporter